MAWSHDGTKLAHGPSSEGAYQFVAICADAAGAWGEAAHNVFQECVSRIDPSRRGHVVSLWWQFLSVAFEQERERVVCHKTLASLVDLVDSATSIDIESMDLLPSSSQ